MVQFSEYPCHARAGDGVLIIAAPWLFGFSDVSDAKAICIVVGIVMLLAGAMTQWRLFLVKLIPLRMHFGTDLLIAAVLILTPFIFGFSDEGGATRFMIIAGALEAMTALSTRWDPAEADIDSRTRGGRAAQA